MTIDQKFMCSKYGHLWQGLSEQDTIDLLKKQEIKELMVRCVHCGKIDKYHD